MATSPDHPNVIRQAQERILAALDKVGDVTCSACGGAIMPVFSVYSDWMWIAVYGQETVPALQCPRVPGLHGLGYGPHQPKVVDPKAVDVDGIPFTTGDLG
jgi:hypothetical protein